MSLPATLVLTPGEVARHLRISKATIYRLCEDGTLPAVRVGTTVRILRRDYLAWLGQQLG